MKHLIKILYLLVISVIWLSFVGIIVTFEFLWSLKIKCKFSYNPRSQEKQNYGDYHSAMLNLLILSTNQKDMLYITMKIIHLDHSFIICGI